MAQIVNSILTAMVDHLTEHMKTPIDATDLTYVDTIKKGLLQDNKLKRNVAIGLTGGDHDDPTYRDGIVTDEKMPNIGFVLDPREIGGGQMWYRRGVARLECFFIRERLTEDEAFDAGYEILGRLMQNIENLDVSYLYDDFGEHAIMLFCNANTFFESGGGPKSFIFRGKVFWQCLTERE